MPLQCNKIFLFQINAFYSLNNVEKIHKNIKSTTVFNMDNNKIFFKQEISILGWLLKDHGCVSQKYRKPKYQGRFWGGGNAPLSTSLAPPLAPPKFGVILQQTILDEMRCLSCKLYVYKTKNIISC